MQENRFTKCSDSFFVDADYRKTLQAKGISCIEDVFAFEEGVNLTKNNLARFRERIRFEVDEPETVLFLKRYKNPPKTIQLKNWLAAKNRKSCAWFDYGIGEKLAGLGIAAAKVICYGEQFGLLFEKRSFCITEKIPDAESLERTLPGFFHGPSTVENQKQRKEFIKSLALFIRNFHRAGFCHRDLYLCHIFYSDDKFYLIDLARTFKPVLFKQRYQIKDIAQLYYSASGEFFTKADRLRFYFYLTGCKKLKKKDNIFIKKVKKKAERIARHDKKHGKAAPFENKKRY